MYRPWTARKSTTLDKSAIETETFTRAYHVFRDDIEPATARRQALRLLALYVCLLMPVHCAICWLASYSLGIAALAVIMVAFGSFVVAIAKWLALEDVLQKLPLVLVFGLVLLGVSFLTSVRFDGWFGGADFFGTTFIVVTVISILGGLWRPMATAYQTVTMKVPCRDLCVAGITMLASLALTAIAQFMHQYGFAVLTCMVVAGYAALVVREYAAWAQANPNLSLERIKAFAKSPDPAEKSASPSDEESSELFWALSSAVTFGAGFGILLILVAYQTSPNREFYNCVLWMMENDPAQVHAGFNTLLIVGLVYMFLGFCIVSSTLKGFRFANPLDGLTLAGKAMVVFLTYPNAQHPLAHKIRTRWLRPLSVRMAVTGFVLVAAATVAFFGSNQVPVADANAKLPEKRVEPPPAKQRFIRQPAKQQDLPPGDVKFAEIFGRPQDVDRRPEPVPKEMPRVPTNEPVSSGNAGRLLFFAIALMVGPPIFVYGMVWFVGLTVLPTYFDYFEQPEATAPGAGNSDARGSDNSKKEKTP